jgi:hypothetical protein
MRSPVLAGVLAALVLESSAAMAADPQQPQEPSPSPQRPAQAQPQTPEQQDAAARKKLEEDIAKELGQGGSKAAAASAQAQPAPGSGPAGPQGGAGGNPMARLLLLPDISAIGSFAGVLDNYDVATRSPREGLFGPNSKPTPLFDELELGLQSIIDPYARADIFISFTPGGVDVEEAYLTTLSLPGGLQVKAGKFFSPFGRQNQQHPHVQEFVDAPLARGRLVAAETLSGPGVEVAWLAPLPWFAELHLAGQGTAPTEEDPERLTGVARLLQYFPLGEATTIGIGVSAARRDEGSPGAFRDLGVADAYLRWRSLGTRAYVTLQGELYKRRFRNAEGEDGTGGYAQLFLRPGAYFGYGVRYDDAPAAGDAAPGRERRYGAVAAWLPSEFQRIRLQVSYDRVPDGRSGIEAILGLEIGIGSHGAHPF